MSNMSWGRGMSLTPEEHSDIKSKVIAVFEEHWKRHTEQYFDVDVYDNAHAKNVLYEAEQDCFELFPAWVKKEQVKVLMLCWRMAHTKDKEYTFADGIEGLVPFDANFPRIYQHHPLAGTERSWGTSCYVSASVINYHCDRWNAYSQAIRKRFPKKMRGVGTMDRMHNQATTRRIAWFKQPETDCPETIAKMEEVYLAKMNALSLKFIGEAESRLRRNQQ